MLVETPGHLLMVFAAVPLRLAPTAFAVVADGRPAVSAPLLPGRRLPPLLGPRRNLPHPAVEGAMRPYTMRDLNRLHVHPMGHRVYALAKLGGRIQSKEPLPLLPRPAAEVPELHAAQVQEGRLKIFCVSGRVCPRRLKPRYGVRHNSLVAALVAHLLGHLDDASYHAGLDQVHLKDAEGVDARGVRQGRAALPRRLRPVPDAQPRGGREEVEEVLQQQHAGEAHVVAARPVEVRLELSWRGRVQRVVGCEAARREDVEGGVRLCYGVCVLWRLGVKGDKGLVVLDPDGHGDLGRELPGQDHLVELGASEAGVGGGPLVGQQQGNVDEVQGRAVA